MIDEIKLSKLAGSYIANKTNDNFEALYKEIRKIYNPYKIRNLAFKFKVDSCDVLAVVDDTIINTLSKCTDIDYYYRYFCKSIKNGLINLSCKVNRKSAICIEYIDDIKSDDRINIEEDVITKQLFASVINVVKNNNDPLTTAIIQNFAKYKSINAVGRALGLHHETISRKLRKLAKVV